MDNVNLNRVRKQLIGIYQDFVDFVNNDNSETETILTKKINGWLQMGNCKEYGIHIVSLFDKSKYSIWEGIPARLNINSEGDLIGFVEVSSTETVKMQSRVIVELESRARNNAIESCVNYATLINPTGHEQESVFEKLGYDDLCEYTNRYRKAYVDFMANAILKYAEKYPGYIDILRGLGLTTVQDFHDRNLNYVEKMYEEVKVLMSH